MLNLATFPTPWYILPGSCHLPCRLANWQASANNTIQEAVTSQRCSPGSTSLLHWSLNNASAPSANDPTSQECVAQAPSAHYLPDVLKFTDVVESDTAVYIMTERVRLLLTALQTWASNPSRTSKLVALGVAHQVSVRRRIKLLCARAVFLENVRSCLRSSTTLLHQPHSSVRTNAIFMSPAGKCQWKLSGIGLSSNPKDDNPVLYVSITLA
ncbi:hypothetical protein V8E55_010491 [Tylopilus felleus]